eukprot:6212618-Pleurochrysis_carterae.AAC.5
MGRASRADSASSMRSARACVDPVSQTQSGLRRDSRGHTALVQLGPAEASDALRQAERHGQAAPRVH